MERGKADRLITFQRATATTNDYGEEILTFAPLQQAWAQVLFGAASEKREAAQEAARQTATFNVDPTAAIRGVTSRDQILVHEDESVWDVQGPGEPLDRRKMRFTAVRSV